MRSSLDGRGATCRSPHGERGLKYAGDLEVHVGLESLSSRRAWIEIGNAFCTSPPVKSLSSRRAWIEMQTRWRNRKKKERRSPHGERGLKCSTKDTAGNGASSSPHGERGLKLRAILRLAYRRGRSPHGERGLKWHVGDQGRNRHQVALLTESVD